MTTAPPSPAPPPLLLLLLPRVVASSSPAGRSNGVAGLRRAGCATTATGACSRPNADAASRLDLDHLRRTARRSVVSNGGDSVVSWGTRGAPRFRWLGDPTRLTLPHRRRSPPPSPTRFRVDGCDEPSRSPLWLRRVVYRSPRRWRIRPLRATATTIATRGAALPAITEGWKRLFWLSVVVVDGEARERDHIHHAFLSCSPTQVDPPQQPIVVVIVVTVAKVAPPEAATEWHDGRRESLAPCSPSI